MSAAENPFIEWVNTYRPDPVRFVSEVFGVDPDPWQLEVLKDYAAGERRVSIRSGHGVGKTAVLAWIIVHHNVYRFPQKTVATAATGTQLFDALVPETKTWFGKLPPAIANLFEIKAERIELKSAPTESFTSFRTSRADQPEALAGVHSEHVLLIGDEASGIPEQVFEAAAGSMSGHSACTILAGNPVRTSGLFFETHAKLRDIWKTHHVSCEISPRVSKDFIEDARRRWGEESNQFRVRVLGEFPKRDDDTVIPFELVESALKRDVQPKLHKPVWGLDVARFGSDACALAKRRGNTLLRPVEEWRGFDTMQTVGRVKSEWDETPFNDRPEEILIDAIGIGAGVADRLHELGLPARSINVSEAPSLKGQHINLRAELWFKAQDWFYAKDCTINGDEGLAAELVQPRFKYTSSGKKQVESKDDMKKRGVPSPNKADAFVLTMAGDAITAAGGSSKSWGKALVREIKGIV